MTNEEMNSKMQKTDYTAHERMIEFASMVIQLPAKDQPKVFEYLAASGILTYEQANGLQTYVGYAHLFLDRDYYEAVSGAVRERICNEIWPFDKNPTALE